MEEKEIKKNWRKMIVLTVLGAVLLIVSILFHRFGSKQAVPQTFWFFAGFFGAFLGVASLLKMNRFRKYLKERS